MIDRSRTPKPPVRSSDAGWPIFSLAALLAIAVAVDYLLPPSKHCQAVPFEGAESDDRVSSAADGARDRGRAATTPSEIPARGWKDILLRVYDNISKHRVLALAAGMTYYSILAIFPGLRPLSLCTAFSPIPRPSRSISIKPRDSCPAAPSTSRGSSSAG